MLRSIIPGTVKRLAYKILGGGSQSHAAQPSLNDLLREERINLILDVGANIGQFAREVREYGYTERIISFEPQTAAHARLRDLAARDPNWTVAERTALGAESGLITIHRSRNG
jgi:hypothetical protein